MLKFFKVNQSNWQEFTCEIGTFPILMLTNSGFEILRAANVVFTIGTFQDIHLSLPFVFNYWSYKLPGKNVVERSRNNIFSHRNASRNAPVVERSRNERDP